MLRGQSFFSSSSLSLEGRESTLESELLQLRATDFTRTGTFEVTGFPNTRAGGGACTLAGAVDSTPIKAHLTFHHLGL